jgi:hypothetical protein
MREDLERIAEMKGPVLWQHQTTLGCFDPETPTQAELAIMQEQAEALGRTGGKLDESLQRLKILEERMRILEREGEGAREVNALIREFNQVRERACQYLHYLIIQREAIGFRRHANVKMMYQIPFKKQPLPDDEVREGHHP